MQRSTLDFSHNLDFLSDSDMMKGIICLHALVLCADAVVSYGIQAAIGKVISHVSYCSMHFFVRMSSDSSVILYLFTFNY